MNRLIQQQKDLDDDIADCNKKLERAEKMISGLEGEKVRWTDTVKDLGQKQELLIGDCLVASGCIFYLGPFTIFYRQELIQGWSKKIADLGINISKGVDLRAVLGNDVTIR